MAVLVAPVALVAVLVTWPVRRPLEARVAGPREPPGAGVITEPLLRRHLTFLSADALEGRSTPSRGLDTAALFLASQLDRLGLRPAGDNGSYLQTIALTRRRHVVEGTTLRLGSRHLAFGEDFLPGDVTGSAEGSMIYVGNGTVIPSRGLDPFKGLDVTGRIVVSHAGLPTGFTRADLDRAGDDGWESTETAAARRGAVAVLYLPDYASLDRWAATRAAWPARAPITVDAFEAASPTLPTATLSAHAVGELFRGEQVPPQEVFQRAVRREPAEPFALAATKVVTLSVAGTTERLGASNVVAVVDGADARRAAEYVALGAHYDHLGTATAPNADGDAVFNGADDDGSGTAGLLAIAEAFARTKTRPRRSVLFVWHAGEEQGLWGSRYFTEHPTVPLDRITAQLNIDMIGRGRPAGSPAPAGSLALTDTDSVYVVGSRRISPNLGATIDQVNARYHRLRLDASLDDPADPSQIYERSDHFNYAKRGIPVAFFFTGIHGDYHGLDDEVERIDFTKLRRITQTVYAIARRLADGE